ncbi:two-component sensor histidine kinase [Agromyces rhizosphaerae]|uniref:histidine kinase n=1 Tax=Agromyces rhizosphaerae TaxID=88374 RepID=A0A9W6FPW5_9MICO|nr:histidine kinase [Agromyces rhizosphaerae]GLI25952.1 two-component sensor histidine kinase [Agromyces rhizosphaerae]
MPRAGAARSLRSDRAVPARAARGDLVRLLAPVVLSALVQVPAAIWVAVRVAETPAVGALAVLLAFAGPAALLAARRWPGPTVAATAVLAMADLLLVPGPGVTAVALGVAIVLGVARGATAWALGSVAAGWVASLALGAELGLDWHPLRIAAVTAGLALCVVLGTVLGHRRSRLARLREEAERDRLAAEQAERVRIARQLHGVLAGSLARIDVESAAGLQRFADDPDEARDALASISATSRAALEEVREVLGALGGDSPLVRLDPEADLAALPALIDGFAGTGLDVELHDRLASLPSAAVQRAAYGIVQEALTNAVRHAASSAFVSLAPAGETLVLVIDDDGPGFGDAEPGAGMLGMRERTAALGGTIDFEVSPFGGARVRARLPRSA